MTARRRPTRTEKEAILERQENICPGCMKTMSGATAVEFDHRRDGLPRWFFTDDPDVDPDDPLYQNAMHKKCHDRLFADDMKKIAKTKRQRGETGQTARRLRGATQRIPSRPFSSRRS
jgi:hypothetical protein